MIKASHVLESVSIFRMFPRKHMPHLDTHMWSVSVCVCVLGCDLKFIFRRGLGEKS